MSPRILFAAALLVASTAPIAHGDAFSLTDAFTGKGVPADYLDVKTAVETYAANPTDANYAAIFTAINSNAALVTTLDGGSYSVSEPISSFSGVAGGVYLKNGAVLDASGRTDLFYDTEPERIFSIANGLAVFIAEPGSSYTFTENKSADHFIFATDGTVFGASANSTVMFNNASFINNGGSYGNGGAINTGGITTFTNVSFKENASGAGDAILNAGSMTIVKSLFSKNSLNRGGDDTISNSLSSQLTIVDTVFTQNYTSYAISTDGGSTLNLKVSEGNISVFQDRNGGYANAVSVYMGASSSTPITLNVTTAPEGTLYMFDPMRATSVAQTTITKNGEGTWKLAGTNTLTGCTFSVNGGTLHLYGSNETEGAIHIENIGNGETYDLAETTPEAGVLALGGGNFTLDDGAQLVFGGTDSVLATTGTVTLKGNSEVVFAIVSTDEHGVIKANNLVIEGGYLTLDLSYEFASSAGVGTTLTLFTESGSLTPKSPSGEFDGIGDLQHYFVWGMLDDGRIQILEFNDAVQPPVPEPSTYALIGAVGALGLALLRRRRKK